MMKKFTSMAKFAKNVMLAAFVAAGVQVANAQETTTSYEPVGANQWWMGEDVAKVSSAYLFNVGAQIFATDNTPKETNIDNANLWTIKSGYTFTNENTKNVIHMDAKFGWNLAWNWATAIQEKDASSFTLKSGKTQNKGKAYGLSVKPGRNDNETRYFSVSGSSYTAAKQSTNSDWIFISATQKAAYTEYTTNFNKVKNYLSNEEVLKNADLVKEINTSLTQTSTNGNNYNTYKSEGTNDKSNLETTIADVEKYLLSTGIKNVETVDGNADVTAIYGVNGVRKNSLTKGINIVKTADGKVKKVLVK